jgi:hypothetical protein
LLLLLLVGGDDYPMMKRARHCVAVSMDTVTQCASIHVLCALLL